jgi:hypothetical protein
MTSPVSVSTTGLSPLPLSSGSSADAAKSSAKCNEPCT